MLQVLQLSTLPHQTLNVALSINGTLAPVIVECGFNEMAGYWMLDISNGLGNPLVFSVPVVTGIWPAANMLAQQGYLNIGNWYCVNVSGVPQDYPDSTNLGTSFQIWVGDNDWFTQQQLALAA